MAHITLVYPELNNFEYEAEVDYGSFLGEYLEETFDSVKDAVESLAKEGLFYGDDEDKAEALQCKNLKELAQYIIDAGGDWADSIVESDEGFVEDFVKEALKEEDEEDAYDAYRDAADGCDPDGFYGWDDYWHWKNG